VQNKTFHFEIHDLINAFITAFDDIIISRYNKNREEKELIKVKYVYAPKERVLFDIVNKAQNITLPAVAISQTGLQRDESRVFNKLYGFDLAQLQADNSYRNIIRHIGMPVPIDISISMSIICKYQTDLDQIISNFVPYNNPYVILSWKVPESFNLANINEIRSEVLWSGSISYTLPVDTTASDKFHYVADTSFTIKGWLFPSAPLDPLKSIYFINSNLYASRLTQSDQFTGFVVNQDLEQTNLSATPVITNIYHTANNVPHEVFDLITFNKLNNHTLTLLGKNFDYTTQVWLSSNTDLGFSLLSLLDFTYYPSITGHPLSSADYFISTPNTMTITLPSLTGTQYIDIIVINDVGWVSTASQGVKILHTDV
jgi:hypothetical protein